MAVLKEQEEFENIFEYIDYLELSFQIIYDTMKEEYDMDEMKAIVDEINEVWYYGSD